jgi:hypothetical protein
MKRKVSIQKSFVFGVTAVAVVAVLTGAVMRLTTISANPVIGNGQSCVAGSTVTPSEPTAQELTNYGANAKAYNVFTKQDKSFRLVIGVTEQTHIGVGGVVNFKVGLANLNNFVYTEKKGRVVLILPNKQTLDLYYGDPNLAIGAYW